MPWSIVIAQERAVDSLQRAVTSGRVAHAYLFHGPSGVGKRAAALAFAEALVGAGDANAADRARRLIHPDVQVMMPAPKGTAPADFAERNEHLAADPYAAVDFVSRPTLGDPTKTSNKQAIYDVTRVNDSLRRTMSYRPSEAPYKVAILTDVELMRVEAANAFLKLLEEPTPRTVFVLTTSRMERLLPTITSRCQSVRFDPLAPEDIAEALVARKNVGAARAATLARMADGSYARALDLAASDHLAEDRGRVLGFLRVAYAAGRSADQAGKLQDQVDEMARMGRQRVKGLLALLLSWLRDLLLLRTLETAMPGAKNDALLVNVDQADAARRFVANLPGADLEGMTRLVEEATYLVERNVNLPLLLAVLANALRSGMTARAPESLYVPLSHPVG